MFTLVVLRKEFVFLSMLCRGKSIEKRDINLLQKYVYEVGTLFILFIYFYIIKQEERSFSELVGMFLKKKYILFLSNCEKIKGVFREVNLMFD